ncbi:kinase-like domain-containing protein [Gigaspora rosea]|uniref:Kinase-like domain-containing protein n=1 Tax=Gigaspora rosea TaxID=44941 RepID=A0A397UNX4_9GLOM|nr:kinase-like domain-containing protein [Gigaspora rosea]
MQYAPMGSLRKNLHEIAQMKWEKKLELISYIALELHKIHSNNIIHCDLHSGNIFQNDLYNAYIGDLGFAKSINKILDKESKGIYGALPYIAPEVLQGKSFTKASDIYSFGMIMWEISSGYLVFSDYKDNDISFATEICLNELRPKILKGTAKCFEELLKQCWDKDPEKRPSCLEIYEKVLKWKNTTEHVDEFLKSDNEIMIKINESNNMEDSTIHSSKFNKFISYNNQQPFGYLAANKINSNYIINFEDY